MSGAPLAEKLRRLIELNGPMSVADYMAHCLTDPRHGYYATRDPLGAGGDFVTAPEVSQMFGELLGAWLVHVWRLGGAPAAVRLVELGPGRGTLMADMLRVANRAPEFMRGASVHLVETSPALRAKQAATLAKSGMIAEWHDRFSDVSDGPLLLVANEFFDALPARQFVRASGEWRERVVGIAPDGRLSLGVGPGRLSDGPAAPDGAIFETSPAREAVMAEIALRLARHGGAALIIDYGHAESAPGDTFQAVRGHGHADPLADPGEADLTSHVDFAALCRTTEAAGAAAHGPIDQGEFLLALGLAERAERLAAAADETGRAEIRAALHRLASPEEMGSLFKVLAVTHPALVPPPFPGSV